MEERALEMAVQVAREVGAILRGGRNADKQASVKSNRYDPVTIFDRIAERVIVSAIERAFPEHGILSEEGTCRNESSPYLWVIDPLDGTNNFLRGYPQFSVSIALLNRGEGRVACVYDPLRDELFTAIAGRGALLNGEPLRVSEQPSIDGAMIGVGLSSLPQRALRSNETERRLIPRVRALRNSGSACLNLAYVAAGRLDASWFVALSPWDVAAATLLIHEAGGRVTDLRGNELTDPGAGVVATNGKIHEEMLAIIGEDRAL